MTRAIEPIGRFFEMDAEGYVINDAACEKIVTPWSDVIEEMKTAYLHHLGENLHSIYVRGSVARGLAVPGFSDIDTFALVLPQYGEQFQWKEASWTEEYTKKLEGHYDCFTKVEFMLTTLTDDLLQQEGGLPMVIKTQSACMYGEDVSSRIRRFRPDRTMMVERSWFRTDLEDFRQKLAHMGDPVAIKKICSSLMKVMIRNGFELVMEREGKYTMDLYLCCRTFVHYYPDHAQEMWQALEWYLNPIDNKNQLFLIADRLGEWMLRAE